MAEPVEPPKAADLARLLSAPPRRRWGRWIWAAAVVGGLVAGVWWWQGRTEEVSAGVRYVTEAVTRGDLTVTVTATGTVQPTTKVDISSELSGTLLSVDVDFNDPVTVGQVLARLDATKLAAQVANAEAQVVSARARLVQAEATAREASETLRTQKELSARGVTTRQSMISVEVAHDRAAAAVEIAGADLRLAEANLAVIRADLEKAEIRSPINGVVLNRTAEVGQIVAASLSAPILFTLAEDLAHMDLLVDVDEADIGRVAPGQVAEFTVDAHDDRSFPATITEVRYAPETTDQVVTYKAVLAVENPDLVLRPGMTATAVITVAQETAVLQVPNMALRYAPPKLAEGAGGMSGLAGLILPSPASRGGSAGVATGRSLWVLRDGAPVEVPVTIGATDGSHTAVTSDALAEGDLVITEQIGSGS